MDSSVSIGKVPHTFYETIDGFGEHLKVSYIGYEAMDSSVSIAKVPHIFYETTDGFVDHLKVSNI